MLGGALRELIFKRFAAGAAKMVVAAILVALLFIFAFAFLLIALDLWLVPRTGAPLAALVTGLAAILVAGLVLLATKYIGRRPPPPRQGELERELANFVGVDTAKRLLKGIERHGLTAAAIALAAGLVVGGSPRVRALLRLMLKL